MLELEGQPILTQGEYAQMMQGFPPGAGGGSGILQAWWLGDEPSPLEAYAAVNVEARLGVRGGEALKIADDVAGRIRDAFPEVAA